MSDNEPRFLFFCLSTEMSGAERLPDKHAIAAPRRLLLPGQVRWIFTPDSLVRYGHRCGAFLVSSLGRNNASLAERSPAMVMCGRAWLQQLQQFVYKF